MQRPRRPTPYTRERVRSRFLNCVTSPRKAAPYLRLLVAGFPLRLPGFELQASHVGFVVDSVALGQVSLRVLRFPLPILIPPTAPHSSSSGAGTIGQLVADVPSGLSLNSHPKKLKESPWATLTLCCRQQVAASYLFCGPARRSEQCVI
jgi:hypothetical protein